MGSRHPSATYSRIALPIGRGSQVTQAGTGGKAGSRSPVLLESVMMVAIGLRAAATTC
jgi:hypothetical protein